ALHVAGVTGDPLEPGDGKAVPQEGRQRDDPTIGLLGEAQEVAIRIDRVPLGVREIRVLDDIDARGPVRAHDVADRFSVDDGHLECHGSTRVWRPMWDRRQYRDMVSHDPRRGTAPWRNERSSTRSASRPRT